MAYVNPAAHEQVEAAAGGSGGQASSRRGAAFSVEEDLAILEGYVRASNNPLKGANQKESAFMECLRKEFLLNSRCPFVSSDDQALKVRLSTNNDESRQLATRWYSRNSRSIHRRALEMKAACSKLHGKYMLVLECELTGNIDEDGLFRAAAHLYNGNSFDRTELYNVAKNEDGYKPKFKFEHCYKFARLRPDLLQHILAGEDALLTTGPTEAATAPLQSAGGSVDPAVASDTRPARPIGQKTMRGKRKVGEELSVLTNYLDNVASALKEPIVIASCESTNGTGSGAASDKLFSAGQALEYYKLLAAEGSGVLEDAVGSSALKKQRQEASTAVHTLFLSSVRELTASIRSAGPTEVEQPGQPQATTLDRRPVCSLFQGEDSDGENEGNDDRPGDGGFKGASDSELGEE
jgi:hypothetical protein